MVNILKLLDIFPNNYVLTYKGKEKFKTNLGGLLTIFAITAIIINGFFIGKDLFFKEKPKVIEITKDEKFSPTFRLTENNTVLGFGMSNDTSVIDDDSLFVINPIYYVQTTNNKSEAIYKEYLLEIEDCNKSKNYSIYSNKCIKNMDLYLAGSWQESSITYLFLDVRKCSNSTESLLRSNIQTEEDKNTFENFLKDINNYQNSEYTVDKNYNKGLNLLEKLKNIEDNR